VAPFDREGALKRAEKALRQGRVDAAIEEYQGIVLAQPRDWNSANALGDLFVRSGQLDRGVEQYTRIADHLAEEGFYPKASALYKKILKVKPTEEYALIRSGDVAAKLGLLADAKSAYQTVADRRRKIGNVRGAAEMAVRLGTVDPEDFDARYAAAKAARELGDTDTALRELRAAALGFEEKARHEEARGAYRDILELAPDDEEARARVLAANIATGEFSSAFALASSPDELRQLALALEQAGQHADVLAVWARVADLDPSDVAARVRVVRGHLAAADTASARRHLTPEVAALDSTVWMSLAEAELRQGRFDDGRAAVASALAANPAQREAAIAMACRLAEQSPDSAYPGIEAVTDAALADGDYAAAAAALHEFVTRVRRHIVALMRLVEICVDGGLEATMYSAQAQLADAYLDAGRGLEARIISEDLVAREPWDRANIERFRRALEMLGEADPDAIIADRLSGDSPFMATDKMDLNEGVVFDDPVEEPEPVAASHAADRAEPSGKVDLSEALGDDGGRGAAGKRNKAGRAARPADGSTEGQKGQDEQLAAEQLRLALTYRDMGMIDDAIQSLERASRSSRQRFEAASILGRLHMDRGERSRAVDWFERAAEAPAPTADAGRALLYDLADVLEAVGEAGRALAVFGELDADVPGYRDVAARIERLGRVQARG
jgi:tetratricopeptide (TPR) repeat protein